MTQVEYRTNWGVWATSGLLPTLGCVWSYVTALAQLCSDCNATSSSQQEMVTGIFYPVCPCNWYPGQSSTPLRLHSMCPTVLRGDMPISSNDFLRQLLYSTHVHFNCWPLSLSQCSDGMLSQVDLMLDGVRWGDVLGGNDFTLPHSTPLLPPGWQCVQGDGGVDTERNHILGMPWLHLKVFKRRLCCSMLVQ